MIFPHGWVSVGVEMYPSTPLGLLLEMSMTPFVGIPPLVYCSAPPFQQTLGERAQGLCFGLCPIANGAI